MTRGTTWKGVEYLVLTKVQIRIALTLEPSNYKELGAYNGKYTMPAAQNREQKNVVYYPVSVE